MSQNDLVLSHNAPCGHAVSLIMTSPRSWIPLRIPPSPFNFALTLSSASYFPFHIPHFFFALSSSTFYSHHFLFPSFVVMVSVVVFVVIVIVAIFVVVVAIVVVSILRWPNFKSIHSVVPCLIFFSTLTYFLLPVSIFNLLSSVFVCYSPSWLRLERIPSISESLSLDFFLLHFFFFFFVGIQ